MIVFEKQGGVIAAYDPDYTPPRNPHAPKRGKITDMSRKSRRALLLLLNRVDYSGRVVFITLTFHGNPTLSQSNAAFKRFRAWFGYSYPGAAVIWRREQQPGRGAFHFHLLVYGMAFIPQNALQAIWTRCTGEDLSIVDIRLVHSRKHAMKYVSKYIAKLPDEPGITSLELSPYLQKKEKPSVGRAWGWINQEALPMAPVERIVIDDPDISASFWLAASALTGLRCGNDPHLCILLSDQADWLLMRIKQRAAWWRQLLSQEGKICYSGDELRTHMHVINSHERKSHDRAS